LCSVFPSPLVFPQFSPKPCLKPAEGGRTEGIPLVDVGWCWQVGPLLVPRSGHVFTYPDHRGTHNLSTLSAPDPQLTQVTVAKWEPEPAPRPCPCHCFAFLSPRPIVLLLRQRQPFSGRRVMSSFSSTSRSSWPQYGPVPLTRCPDCPRQEPLKRSICKTDENGNRGREFVACESLPYREGDKVRSRSNFSVFSRFSCYSLEFGI
jgi:hypothetical protein